MQQGGLQIRLHYKVYDRVCLPAIVIRRMIGYVRVRVTVFIKVCVPAIAVTTTHGANGAPAPL